MASRFAWAVVALLAVVGPTASASNSKMTEAATQLSNLRPRVTVTLGNTQALHPHPLHHHRSRHATLRARDRAREANQAGTAAAIGKEFVHSTQARAEVSSPVVQEPMIGKTQAEQTTNDAKPAAARAAAQLAAAARRASVLDAAAHAKEPAVSNWDAAQVKEVAQPTEISAPASVVAAPVTVASEPAVTQPEEETVKVVHQVRQELAEVHQHQTNVMQLESALAADKALLHESNLLLSVTQSRSARAMAVRQVERSRELVKSTQDMLADSRLAAAADAQSAVREVDTISAATEELRKAALEELQKYGTSVASSTVTDPSTAQKSTAEKTSLRTDAFVNGQTIEDEN